MRAGCKTEAVIAEVRISSLLQGPIESTRPHLNPERIAHFVSHLDESDPVTVFETDEGLMLADGHHRVAAASQLARTSIKAQVRRGSHKDVLEFAVHLSSEEGNDERGGRPRRPD
jgi:ParB-like chromosome segregation protein Spo0J